MTLRVDCFNPNSYGKIFGMAPGAITPEAVKPAAGVQEIYNRQKEKGQEQVTGKPKRKVAPAGYDGPDVIARYMEQMNDEEIQSIIADINFDAGQFADLVRNYARMELGSRWGKVV